MKTKKISAFAAKAFILLSGLSLLSVSIMAFADPQAVMDLVQVKLTNTDAFSSIRGVYGGVGLTIFLSLLYFLRTDTQAGLGFLCLLWGFYAVSRLITIFKEGELGAFGNQWLVIESVFFLIAVTLFSINRKTAKPQTAL